MFCHAGPEGQDQHRGEQRRRRRRPAGGVHEQQRAAGEVRDDDQHAVRARSRRDRRWRTAPCRCSSGTSEKCPLWGSRSVSSPRRARSQRPRPLVDPAASSRASRDRSPPPSTTSRAASAIAGRVEASIRARPRTRATLPCQPWTVPGHSDAAPAERRYRAAPAGDDAVALPRRARRAAMPSPGGGGTYDVVSCGAPGANGVNRAWQVVARLRRPLLRHRAGLPGAVGLLGAARRGDGAELHRRRLQLDAPAGAILDRMVIWRTGYRFRARPPRRPLVRAGLQGPTPP